MQSAVLKVEKVDKRIGRKLILQDISIEIGKGEIVGLLGPNGSGKTTLIRLIVGLMKKNNGRIMINGYSQDEDFLHAMSSVGAIIENPEFYSYLTGFENLELYAAMHDGVTEERMQEVVKRVRLEHAIHQKVKTYSLGMKQRLGIAQAILHQPNLLILDEPTNGLDPAGMKEFREHLQMLVREEGTSVLFATHLLHEVEELCDRMIIIQKGQIKASAKLRDMEGKEQILMNIQPVEKAVSWLDTQAYTYERNGARVLLHLNKEQVPELNKQLVMAGFDVLEMTPQKPSIEEAFMKWTEGGTADASTHQE
ncbi:MULTISPECIES: ABC transporter ATP-binding protein [Bacillus]|uniref:ABC transporter ATP-binding protein n=1 Tax=Bacillus TaxID=1386 RepID=UPI00081FA60B|nr:MULTISPECIES: ABC transporter ATP-binding protein [Bacillus]AOC57730.1 ABC transporter ATP-binding protein [Bacillus pumilus]MBR0587922.1 ABC transporter ATP-binding protein [Bacillus pumilus DW2J2]MBR0617302.1 ABC transporter ATP-binding protein [Bacillus pumilus]MBR0626254.1 ABC transporter ATP-binding protein [Bacillus pumilus]MCY7724273.1 ABC transporter ATP-binding protein [Bacillus pumilus]